MAVVKCFPLNTSGRGLEWINGDDLVWSSALHLVTLTLIARTGGTMARSSIGSVNVSKIKKQLRVVMTFSPLISDDVKDGLKLSYLGEAISDKGPLLKPESDELTMDDTTVDAYGGDKVDSMPDMIDQDALVHTAWPIIQKKAAEVESVQNLQLKQSLTAAFQPLGPFFFGRHDIESLKMPIIVPGPEFELGCLYRAGSRMKRKALELHQDRVEEARLDCLAMEIVEQKKEASARRALLELNLQKEKEAIQTLAAMIRQTQEDNAVAAENNKKLKDQKEKYGEIMNRALTSVPTKASSSTQEAFLSSAPPPSTRPLSAPLQTTPPQSDPSQPFASFENSLGDVEQQRSMIESQFD